MYIEGLGEGVFLVFIQVAPWCPNTLHNEDRDRKDMLRICFFEISRHFVICSTNVPLGNALRFPNIAFG